VVGGELVVGFVEVVCFFPPSLSPATPFSGLSAKKKREREREEQ
jgi:hypothetical protein